MLCQTDILSWKNPETDHVVEFLHFSDEESGTRRGCVLLEVRQLTVGEIRTRTNVFWLPASPPTPSQVSRIEVLAGKTETAVDKMYTMSSSWAQDSLCLLAPWYLWGGDWVLDKKCGPGSRSLSWGPSRSLSSCPLAGQLTGPREGLQGPWDSRGRRCSWMAASGSPCWLQRTVEEKEAFVGGPLRFESYSTWQLTHPDSHRWQKANIGNDYNKHVIHLTGLL